MDHMTGALDLVQRMFEVAARRARQPISTVIKSPWRTGERSFQVRVLRL